MGCLISSPILARAGHFSSVALHYPKEPLRAGHVASDLFTQGFHRFELDFVAQALEEDQFDLRLGQQFDFMEVEQVALDGERVGAEGRTHTHVGDRVEALAVDAHSRDVHPVGWHELVVNDPR